MYDYNAMQLPRNALITDNCIELGYISLTPEDKDSADFMFAILSKTKGVFNFQLLISAIVVLYSLISIIMLQRTQKLGELIVMVFQMISELNKFLFTFGLAIGTFIIVGRQLTEEIKLEPASYFKVI